jgi:F0F1-type ATP synthase membrane subunit b/b'
VIKNFQELEGKVRESEEVLALAKANLETAKSKAEQIRQQGESLSIQTSKSIICGIEDDIKRFKNINLLILKMREKKSLNELCQNLSLVSFKKASELIKKRLNSKFHKQLISKKIGKLSRLSRLSKLLKKRLKRRISF